MSDDLLSDEQLRRSVFHGLALGMEMAGRDFSIVAPRRAKFMREAATALLVLAEEPSLIADARARVELLREAADEHDGSIRECYFAEKPGGAPCIHMKIGALLDKHGRTP